MSILRNMQSGTGYFWNPTRLEAGTVASFPSSYQLLPLAAPVSFLTVSRKKSSRSLADFSFWQKFHLGLLTEPKSAAVDEARLAYSRSQLGRAARLTLLLQAMRNPPKGLRVFRAVGTGRPTLARGYLDEKAGRILFQRDEVKKAGLPFAPLEADGDGTVTGASAVLPPALEKLAQVVSSDYGHGNLFLDPEVGNKYDAFLREGAGCEEDSCIN
jgi:hypothetical protein